MNVRRIIGLILVLAGIGGLYYANIQQARIDQGAAEGQRKIDKGKRMFQGNPVTEAFGESVASSAERKMGGIIAGYEQQVQMLKMGSIGVIVIGAAMLIFCSNKERRKK